MSQDNKSVNPRFDQIVDLSSYLETDSQDNSKEKKATQFSSYTLSEAHDDLFHKSSFLDGIKLCASLQKFIAGKDDSSRLYATPANAILLTDATAELIANGEISDTEN